MDFLSDSLPMFPLFNEDHEDMKLQENSILLSIPADNNLLKLNFNELHNSNKSDHSNIDIISNSHVLQLPVFDIVTLPKVIKFNTIENNLTPLNNSSITRRQMKYDKDDIDMFAINF
ncbi:hypothetical protein SS50377_28582 [Spironucleus salmonicida]|uniref:Uncharacterized protein n=1 Tax=Spironucleus salmonicida TaxID=348837 RepID=A0A9P8LKF2_9EUKA|nr:hypothetical protein SS50377_28582 [Spironucleus salmonicida]